MSKSEYIVIPLSKKSKKYKGQSTNFGKNSPFKPSDFED